MQDLENAGPGKWRMSSQGWKMQDLFNDGPPCDLVCHFPGPAFSSLCSFLVRRFQVLQIRHPHFSDFFDNYTDVNQFDVFVVDQRLMPC